MSTSGAELRPAVPRRPRRVVQPTQVLWLTAVWVLLWGDLSVANVASGLVVGVAVAWAFPMPAIRMRLRIRPLRLVAVVLRFLADVVVASLQVAWTTVHPRRTLRNAILEVPLHTQSDFVLTVVAEMTSLVPGSIVVEVRRSDHTLFLHVLDARDLDGVERARRRVLETERRVVAAVGADTSAFEESVAAEGRRP